MVQSSLVLRNQISYHLNEALYKFHQGVEVTDETMAIDLIGEMEFGTRRTYLDTDHTLNHFRQVGWQTRLFDRTYCDHTAPVTLGDENCLVNSLGDRT